MFISLGLVRKIGTLQHCKNKVFNIGVRVYMIQGEAEAIKV